MPKVKRVCRVCGKTYEACNTTTKNSGVFQWRDVACSPECAAEYFRRVTEARKPKVSPSPEPEPQAVVEPTPEPDPAPKKSKRAKSVAKAAEVTLDEAPVEENAENE